jgi:hypothetical protein
MLESDIGREKRSKVTEVGVFRENGTARGKRKPAPGTTRRDEILSKVHL